MADVFISYAREDRARAKRLAGALEARGLSVWWDREILAGQAFDEVIEAELRKAGPWSCYGPSIRSPPSG